MDSGNTEGKSTPALVEGLQCLCSSIFWTSESWIQFSRQGVKLPCHGWGGLWRQYLHRNVVCVFFNEKKSCTVIVGCFSKSVWQFLTPKQKQRLLLAPHMKSLCVFSPLAPLRVRHSHSIWLWSVEADSGIVRKCVCLKPRWILLIAWALRLWDQKCDWEIMKDSGGILVGFSHSSPCLYLKRIIICMGSSLDWDLTCLSMFVQHLPQRGLAACLGIFGILALYFADAQGRKYSCNRKRRILPSTPSPVRDSLWGFSHSLQACEADFIPSRGIWTPQCWVFSLFLSGSASHTWEPEWSHLQTQSL